MRNSCYNFTMITSTTACTDDIDIKPASQDLTDRESKEMVILVMTVVFVILLFMFSVIINTIIIIIHINNHSLKTISNSFILNLLAINLLSGLTLVPLMLLDLIMMEMVPDKMSLSSLSCICTFSNIISVFIFSLSQFSTFLIACDHYVAIIFPLRYHHLLTRIRSNISIFGSWLLSLAITTIVCCTYPPDNSLWPFCPRDVSTSSDNIIFAKTLITITFLLPTLVTIIIYIKIYSAAHTSSERTRKCSLKPSEQVGSDSLPASVRHRISNAGQLLVRDEGRTAAVYLISTASIVICWTPMVVSRLLPDSIPSFLVLSLAVSFTLISPAVYAGRNKKVQTELLKLFRVKYDDNPPEVATRPGNEPLTEHKHSASKLCVEFPVPPLNNSFLSLPPSSDNSARSSFSSSSTSVTFTTMSVPCSEHM